MVRVYSTTDGKVLHEIKKHTDWIMAVEYSPDGVLLATAALFFFISVKYMPLADTFAIYFVEPFILTCLSAVFLKEKVGWRRWLAIVVGFGGAMIVIQPSFGTSKAW